MSEEIQLEGFYQIEDGEVVPAAAPSPQGDFVAGHVSTHFHVHIGFMGAKITLTSPSLVETVKKLYPGIPQSSVLAVQTLLDTLYLQYVRGEPLSLKNTSLSQVVQYVSVLFEQIERIEGLSDSAREKIAKVTELLGDLLLFLSLKEAYAGA